MTSHNGIKTVYTDWQKELYGGMGKQTNIQTALSGGNASTSFRIGAGFNRTTAIATQSGADQRISLSVNLSHASTDQRFHISFSNQYSNTLSDMINISGSAVSIPPNAPPIRDALGNLNYAGWGGSNTTARNAFRFSNLENPYSATTSFLNSSLSLIMNYSKD